MSRLYSATAKGFHDHPVRASFRGHRPGLVSFLAQALLSLAMCPPSPTSRAWASLLFRALASSYRAWASSSQGESCLLHSASNLLAR